MAAVASPSVRTPPRAPARGGAAAIWWPIAACLVVAALSLLIAAQPTYDPTAWLIWGREIVHGDLATTYGPSWKPLPAVVTIPAGLLSLDAQQDVWLVVARAGGLMAVVLAFRLARRIEGALAGAIAVVGLVLAHSFVSHVLRGDSEGLLAAFAIGAFEAHASGRRRLAFGLVVLTGLLRPEMLLFVGLYGLWLVWSAPPPERTRTLLAVLAAGALIVLAWLVPEQLGSGQLLRAASRAREPVPNSPAQAAFPFLATFTNAAPVLMWPLYAGGALVVGLDLLAWRRTRRATLALAVAAASTTIMVVVALMAQGGFTGNIRYLTVASALVCVLGGAGLERAARLVAARLRGAVAIGLGVVVAAAVAVPALVLAGGNLHDELHDAMLETHYYDDLPAAIARAGGRDAVLRCGVPYAMAFDTQALARDLGVHEKRVAIHPDRPGSAPGMAFVRSASRPPSGPRWRRVATTRRWIVVASCRA
ncbi:MAG TPA: hypothetical protein VHB30_02695 [Solirubrobacteraceae bacterium]|nr:hypothetical protein [Solirubrobacteraceae bacterium]